MRINNIKPLAKAILLLCLTLCPSCLSFPPDIIARINVKNEAGMPIHFTIKGFENLLEIDFNNEETSSVNSMFFDEEDIEHEEIFPYMLGIEPDTEEEKNSYVEISDMEGNILITWRPDSEHNAFYDESNWQITQEYSGKCRHKREYLTWLFVITPEMLGLD